MADRPILFNGAMVRAILAGKKTQTRRAIKPQPANDPTRHHPIAPYDNGSGGWNWVLAATGHGTGDPFSCPFGQPGDQLWVRETFGYRAQFFERDAAAVGPVVYRADGEDQPALRGMRGDHWRPSIHMPRWACRLVLEVTDLRVERLQAISPADALAEGAMEWASEQDTPIRDLPAGDERIAFAALWDSTGGNWEADPWVWVVGFRVAEGPANG